MTRSVVCLTLENTQYGAVFSLQDSQRSADLFKAKRDGIDGILIGEETAIANALGWAGLDVPVLAHVYPDDVLKMTSTDRRDSFCGKMSCCNNLRQYDISFSLTGLHTVDLESDSFRADGFNGKITAYLGEGELTDDPSRRSAAMAW
jgi:L-fucose isomerase-like protein